MKIVVAHPGQQHSYKTATAIKKNGDLYRYITTFYNKSDKERNKSVFKGVLKRAQNRRCSSLNNDEVITYYTGMFCMLSFLLRYDHSKKLYRKFNELLSDWFGSKVAHYAIKNNVDAVVMYDTTCDRCFDILRRKAPHILRIQDVSAINRVYMKNVYEIDMEQSPQYADVLLRERGFLFEKKNIDRWQREISNSNYFIAPSDIVKRSLMYSGAKADDIFICPYGSNFSAVEKKGYFENNKINAIYVGNVTQMKGIFYLLDAFMELPEEQFSLTVVGQVDLDSGLVNKYRKRIKFTGYVTHEKVKEYLSCADVFVFPSLGDSFGLSVLEAMAYGLPVICSNHAGAADAIVDGFNGWVIEKGEKNLIRDTLLLCNENREQLVLMSKNAISTIGKYTWEYYESSIAFALENIKIKSQKDVFSE